MKLFRKPSKIDPALVKASEPNASDEYAFFTGTPKTNNRKASGRTAVLTLVTEKRRPIPLAELYRRAAKAKGEAGFDPAFVRGGLSLAGLAKPAVYFLLYKDDKGNYRAGVNIPYPDETFSKRSYKKGDIVLPSKAKAKVEKEEAKALPSPDNKSEATA